MKWRLLGNAHIVIIFVLLGGRPALGQDSPDFSGAMNCSFKVESVVDDLGALHGCCVAVDLQHRDPHPLRGSHTVQLYSPQDLRKADSYRAQLYKQFSNKNRIKNNAKTRKEADLTAARR